MKKTSITFMAQGRRRALYRRGKSGPLYVRVLHKGKETWHSLGHTMPDAAKEEARLFIDAIYEENNEFVQRHRQRSDFALLSKIAEIYVEKFGTDKRRRRTARGNVGRLATIVERGGGVRFAEARASVLTDSLVRRYEVAEEWRIVRDARGNMNHRSELQVRTTIDSTLRQARSIFKRSQMSWFDGLELPDLEPFRRQGVRAANRPKPRPLDEGVIHAIEADALRLKAEQPAVYATFLLFSQCGLRNSEITAARRSWIRRRADGTGEIGIIHRPDEVDEFEPKKSERWVPINAQVLAEIEAISQGDPEGYLIPAPNPTRRHEIVNDEHGAWCGQWIKNRSKVSYELRRYAGSLYFDQTNDIMAVQAFLGHAELKTTLDWYWYRLKPLAPLHAPGFLKVVEVAA